MPGPSFFEQFGSRPTKQTRFAPIFINRQFTGLYTQRNPLRDPSDSVREKFYGGRPDALLSGLNVELTNLLTLARRPGLTAFSAATYPQAPDFFYSFRKANGQIDVMVDTASVLYTDNQDGTKTTVLTKSAGAGQSQMIGVGSTLYIGDGVDLQKWNDFGAGVAGNNRGNATNPTWNWGIASPTAAPALTITPSSSASVQWRANTNFTTMGLLIDGSGNVQQLISVNATGTNSTQFGTSSNGQPVWNQTPGGTTADPGGWNWTNFGPIVAWTPLTTYNNASIGGTLLNPCIIYDPVTKCCFIQGNPGFAQGTSGTTRPNFPAGFHQIVHDASVKWFQCGALNIPPVWAPSHSYQYLLTGVDQSKSGVVEPKGLTNGLPSNQTLFWQVNLTGSTQTSGSSGTAPPFSSTVGGQANDGDLIWQGLGSSVRQTTHAYTAWTATGTPFSVILDSNSNLQVCTVSGISSATATGSITWQTGYGQTTTDGSVTWTCVGVALAWAANTVWYLPSTGFFPPSGAVPYGGAGITDSNNNEQFVVNSGKSGATAPAWATTVGANTTDNTITWIMVGPFSTLGFSWTKSHSWGFSYKARLATDAFNTTAPPGWPSALGPPTGSASGGISTTSPPVTITGGNPGAVVTLKGIGSTDPQVDTIVIWRDPDGGGDSNMEFLTEIPSPPAIGGIAQPWTFNDTLDDTNLNPFILAPINHENDPPPAGFVPDTYHFGHIWGHVGNTIYFSGGPDTLAGNGNETFPPTNNFVLPSSVTRSIATATGLLSFTTADIYIVAGGPATTTFFTQPLVPGTGLLSFNALDVHGGTIYLFTSDRQFVSLDPSAGESEVGFPIGDQLSNFNPLNAYVTVHVSGSADKAVYVADGSTGWYRLNPNQAPETGPVWSPKANIVGGCQAVQSIETAPGVHQLLVGSTTTNQPILMRNLSVFSDNGSAYAANFTMGALILAQPGQLAELGFITLDLNRVGTTPTVSFLLDEVTGTFTQFAGSNVSDPPELWGATGHPTSLFSNRYYFNSTMAGNATPPPAWCRFMEIGIDFGNVDTVQNMLLTLTIFGAHYQEK